MKIEEEFILNFYQNLGKLFYAISAADNNVREEELSKLIIVVKEEWLSSDLIKANLKTKAEASIVNTFKWLYQDNEYDAAACFNSFVAFKKEHEELFTDNLKHLIMKTAGAIASSFSGRNKSELIMLARLNLELNKVSK